jgi:TRAP-type transport system periplasmic protein
MRRNEAPANDADEAVYPGAASTTSEGGSAMLQRRQLFVLLGRVAAVAVFTVGLNVANAHSQEFTMKFATQTRNDPHEEFMKEYKAEIEKATNGRIKVDIYTAAQLGSAPRQLEGLRLGTIEAAIGPGELFVGADPRFQTTAMPGLFKSVEHARKVIRSPEVYKAFEEIAASRHLVLAGITFYTFQSFTFKDPVTKIADFSGKRIRVLASPSERGAVSALGGSPVPMALPEVLPALQQGTIDGVNAGLGVFVPFKYYDIAPNMLDSHLWAIISPTLVSQIWFDKLPPDLQKAVRETGPKIQASVDKWIDTRTAEQLKAWKASGGKVAEFSVAEQAEAVKRVTASIQPMFDGNANLKKVYDLIKSVAEKTN